MAILEEHKDEMDQLFPNGYYFQQDNLRVHTSSEDWMKKQGFDILPYPSYSPDLSPIENLWATLKFAVDKENPKTEAKLCESMRRNWEILTKVENLEPYFKNLHDRYLDCIDLKGERLKR
jgi:transposase